MIIETNANQFFKVTDTGLDHAWSGVAVKKTSKGWEPKKNAKIVLVRKAFTTIISH